MKKFKIISLILLILLSIIFLFATCKKTNAYSYTYSQPYLNDTISFNHLSGGTVFILNSDDLHSDMFTIRNEQETFFVLDCIQSNNDNIFRLWNYALQGGIEYSLTLPKSYTYIYMQFCYDYVDDIVYLYIGPIVPTITNRQNNSPYISGLQLGNGLGAIWELDNQAFLNDFLSSQPSTVLLFSYNNANYVKGLYSLFTFDIINQLSNDYEEQIEFIFDDLKSNISINYMNYLIETYYNTGYQTGLTDGMTEGYNNGYNAGYNTGYNAGVNDNQTAFDRGYDEGYQDGYNYGTVHGYDEGYETGYDVGFGEGQAGATPVSKTIGVVSSIFAGVGTVLSIELFPGFPLGLLILVPLFFLVLGLILWIWRRN